MSDTSERLASFGRYLSLVHFASIAACRLPANQTNTASLPKASNSTNVNIARPTRKDSTFASNQASDLSLLVRLAVARLNETQTAPLSLNASQILPQTSTTSQTIEIQQQQQQVSTQTTAQSKIVSTRHKARGANRKCRKVYGVGRRNLWCTQCKWKKACSRFATLTSTSIPIPIPRRPTPTTTQTTINQTITTPNFADSHTIKSAPVIELRAPQVAQPNKPN